MMSLETLSMKIKINAEIWTYIWLNINSDQQLAILKYGITLFGQLVNLVPSKIRKKIQATQLYRINSTHD